MTLLGSFFLISALVFPPNVNLWNEQGVETHGQLQSLTSSEVTLKVEDDLLVIPTNTLMTMQFENPKRIRGAAGAKVYSTDGDLLIARTISVSGNNLKLDSPAAGALALNLNQVKSMLFGKLDDKVSANWNDLISRDIRNDLLVLRKGDVLDFLNGVIGDITPETIKFLTDGTEIPIKREKVFGLIYYRKPKSAGNPPVKIGFTTGESVFANSVELKGNEMILTMDKNVTSILSIDPVKLIDFSQGKLVYVSDLKPVFVEYTPRGFGGNDQIYKQLFQMKTDRHIYGESLKLGSRYFSKGLCLHADTVVRYKLGLQYKQLIGTLGIDPEAFNAHGNARVVLRGDQLVLLEKDVTGLDDPFPLNLDVSKVRELSIEVTTGSDGTDLGDNVIFGGLYLLKQE